MGYLPPSPKSGGWWVKKVGWSRNIQNGEVGGVKSGGWWVVIWIGAFLPFLRNYFLRFVGHVETFLDLSTE